MGSPKRTMFLFNDLLLVCEPSGKKREKRLGDYSIASMHMTVLQRKYGNPSIVLGNDLRTYSCGDAALRSSVAGLAGGDCENEIYFDSQE